MRRTAGSHQGEDISDVGGEKSVIFNEELADSRILEENGWKLQEYT